MALSSSHSHKLTAPIPYSNLMHSHTASPFLLLFCRQLFVYSCENRKIVGAGSSCIDLSSHYSYYLFNRRINWSNHSSMFLNKLVVVVVFAAAWVSDVCAHCELKTPSNFIGSLSSLFFCQLDCWPSVDQRSAWDVVRKTDNCNPVRLFV